MHNGIMYQCDYCEYATTREYDFKKHIENKPASVR